MCNKKEYVKRAKIRITNKFRVMIKIELERYNKQFSDTMIIRVPLFFALNGYIDKIFDIKTKNVYGLMLDKMRDVFK